MNRSLSLSPSLSATLAGGVVEGTLREFVHSDDNNNNDKSS